MSHPANKFERFKIATQKGLRRFRALYPGKQSSPREVGRCRDTTKFCSSWCCGNRRRHFGEITIQERRAPGDSYQWLKLKKKIKNPSI